MSKMKPTAPKIEVFDPPMCCSTGICGPSVVPVLPRFAADLEWLKAYGVPVDRFNLAQQPDAFAKNEIVKRAMAEGENKTVLLPNFDPEKGAPGEVPAESQNNCLPLILVNGRIVEEGTQDDLIHLDGAYCKLYRMQHFGNSELLPDGESISSGGGDKNRCQS